MKHIMFLLILPLICSCSEDYDNQLRAKWQLRTEITASGSYSVDTLYYSFDNHICEIQNSSRGVVNACYMISEDSLEIFFVYSLDSAKLLNGNGYGWSTIKRTFRIEDVSHRRLVLKDKFSEMIFRRF